MNSLPVVECDIKNLVNLVEAFDGSERAVFDAENRRVPSEQHAVVHVQKRLTNRHGVFAEEARGQALALHEFVQNSGVLISAGEDQSILRIIKPIALVTRHQLLHRTPTIGGHVEESALGVPFQGRFGVTTGEFLDGRTRQSSRWRKMFVSLASPSRSAIAQKDRPLRPVAAVRHHRPVPIWHPRVRRGR